MSIRASLKAMPLAFTAGLCRSVLSMMMLKARMNAVSAEGNTVGF